MNSNIPRIVIAAPSSGCGKTTVTCALIAAFGQKAHLSDGLFAVSGDQRIVSFKCGPDYIDPLFHSQLQGVPSYNLDLFFSEENTVRALFHEHAEGSALAVIEGVMGYYDGMGMGTDRGSTYHMSSVLKAPSILVVNGRGKALSIVAEIDGFLRFRRESGIAGVILNHVSPMTYPSLRELIETQLGIPVLGFFPRMEVSLDSRHLGLALPKEQPKLRAVLEQLREQARASVDLERLLRIAKTAEPFDFTPMPPIAPVGSLRIGIARDEAFSFYYADNLRLMEEMGVQWIPFSPLHDSTLPKDLDGLYLGGGYPELHGEALADNISMHASLRRFHLEEKPILAECGGFMYLHRRMEASDGKVYPSVGLVEADTFKTSKLQRFGYITVNTDRPNSLWPLGTAIRAHEFHYWDSTDPGNACLCRKPLGKRQWRALHMTDRLVAGFPHFYFLSNPEAARRWLMLCSRT